MQKKNCKRLKKKNMVVLVDTNVIVDVLMKREPYTKDAQEILTKCATGELEGFLAGRVCSGRNGGLYCNQKSWRFCKIES